MADDTPETPEAKPAPKPRGRRAAPKTDAKPAAVRRVRADADKPKPAIAKAPPKPRSSNRTTASTTARAAKTAVAKTRKVATKATKDVAKATDKVGGKWGAAAIAGGVVAAAGAAAALLTLRGSTPKDPKPKKGAKQADGTDSSKSFNAGIADEGSIPKA